MALLWARSELIMTMAMSKFNYALSQLSPDILFDINFSLYDFFIKLPRRPYWISVLLPPGCVGLGDCNFFQNSQPHLFVNFCSILILVSKFNLVTVLEVRLKHRLKSVSVDYSTTKRAHKTLWVAGLNRDNSLLSKEMPRTTIKIFTFQFYKGCRTIYYCGDRILLIVIVWQPELER